MKVLYHINETDKYKMLQSNLGNTLAYDPDIKVVVVVNGGAVALFKDKTLTLTKNVTYHICNNSLKSNQISTLEIIDGVTIVPSGVIDIIKLQDRNYRYIKP